MNNVNIETMNAVTSAIGKVVASEQSRCVIKMQDPPYPDVGTWINCSERLGILERYVYESEDSLLGHVRILKCGTPWAVPICPGSAAFLYTPHATGLRGHKAIGGYILSGEDPYPFELELEYLLGPEGAHVNASGISGLATKTSYLMSLLWSVMHRAVKDDLPITTFAINLKHQDLMHIHRKAILPPTDARIYDLLHLPQEPFPRVRYYAPNGAPGTARPDVSPFGYSIQTGFSAIRHIVCGLPDHARTLESLVEALLSAREQNPGEFGAFLSWKAFWTEPPLVEDGNRPNSWSHFAMPTVRRFVRHMQHVLEHQNTGVFVNKPISELPTIADIVATALPGETIVLDFSTMTITEQFFCMSELVRAIYSDVTSPHRRLPQHVMLFVDELNRYGARGTGAHPIRDLLLEVSERGRSIGLSLITAQQFASHVHPRIFGNASTRVVGRLTSDELSRPEYKFLSHAHKDWLQYMPKGHLMVHHAPLGQPVKVMFPRPAFCVGEDIP